MLVSTHLKVPETARAGDTILVRTLIKHPMETGWRKDAQDRALPRNRIFRFECTFNDIPVFAADFDGGVSKDPYLAFFLRVPESGVLRCAWHEDGSRVYRDAARIEAIAPKAGA